MAVYHPSVNYITRKQDTGSMVEGLEYAVWSDLVCFS